MRASSELKNHVRHIQKQVDHWHRHQLSQSSSNRLTQIHTQGEEDKEDYMESNELNQSRHEEDALYPRPEADIGGLWSLFNQPPGSQLSVSHPHHSHSEFPIWGPTPLTHLHNFISRHSSPNYPLLPLLVLRCQSSSPIRSLIPCLPMRSLYLPP